MDSRNEAVETLAVIAKHNDFEGAIISRQSVPRPVMRLLSAWARKHKVDLAAFSADVLRGTYASKTHEYYGFEVYKDRVATLAVAIDGHHVIGASTAGKTADLALETLVDLARNNDFSGSHVRKASLTKEVLDKLDAWCQERNLDPAAVDDDVLVGSYFDSEREYFVFSFYSDAAEIWTGIVVLNEYGLIGESSSGSD